MADKAIEKGRTERYLPEKAWTRLTPEERRETDEKKQRASRVVKKYVPNTEKAKKVRRAVDLASKRKQNKS